jgi:integrase
MPRINHISRRGTSQIYQVRLRIPNDLTDVLKRTELTKSLATKDLGEAKKRARAVLDEWEREFELLRQRRDLTETDIHAGMTEHYLAQLDRDETYRLSLPTEAEIDAAMEAAVRRVKADGIEIAEPLAILDASLDFLVLKEKLNLDRKRRKALATDLKKEMANGQSSLVQYAADSFISKHNLNIERESKAYRQLCQRLAQGETEYLKRSFERDKGDFTGTPDDPLLLSASVAPMNRTTFDNIIDEQERLSGLGIGRAIASSTLRKYRTQVKEFSKWRHSTRAATVTKQEAEKWRDELLAGNNQRKTVRDKLGTIRAVLTWGQRHADGNLFPNGTPLEHLVMPTAEPVDSAARTYTLQDARLVLLAARERNEPHLRWVPWLAAYSGARVGELTSIEKSDVVEVGGHYFYHVIHDPAKGRTTKTKKNRKVPLHSALIEEGFLDFVRAAPDGPLFSANRVEQNLRDWIRDEVFEGRSGRRPAPNHGFRHLFEDLRFGQISQEAAYYITGRAIPGSASLYGKSDTMLPQLAVEFSKFPRLL